MGVGVGVGAESALNGGVPMVFDGVVSAPGQ